MGGNEAGQSSDIFALAVLTLIIGVVVHFIYKTIFKNETEETQQLEVEKDSGSATEKSNAETAAADNRPSGKSKKRALWKGKNEFNHPWLVKNLKGHPGTVLLVDFSANGKFMAATCDEDTVTTVDSASVASRRRKQRDRRRPPSPPTAPSAPQRISTEQLVEALRPHLLSPTRMWGMGYPVEIEPFKAIVYIAAPPRLRPNQQTVWDVNAPEFVPSTGSQQDSGRGSWESTPPRTDSDEEADHVVTVEHVCVRCDKKFKITRDFKYVKQQPCTHHWGRVNALGEYTCCDSALNSKGCTTERYHVWNGTRPGMNGPIEGYVRARSPRGGVYAIDVEMCYTAAGLELTSVAVVGIDGRVVYSSLVKPSLPILDYNTRFSGIRPRDMARATKTLRDVQNDILGFVGTDTILIGHALENDLRALKLLHGTVVDTCALYPHARGLPMRRSLRTLSLELLGRHVQRGSSGHSPFEDARAAMDLVLLKVHRERDERRQYLHQLNIFQPYDPLISAA